MNLTNPRIRFKIAGPYGNSLIELYDSINGENVLIWSAELIYELRYLDTGFNSTGTSKIESIVVNGTLASTSEQMPAKVALRVDKSDESNNLIAIEIDGVVYSTYQFSGNAENQRTYHTLLKYDSSLSGASAFTYNSITDNDYTTLNSWRTSAYPYWVSVDFWKNLNIITAPSDPIASRIHDAAWFESNVKTLVSGLPSLGDNQRYISDDYASYGYGQYSEAYDTVSGAESQTPVTPTYLSFMIGLQYAGGYILTLDRGRTFKIYSVVKIGSISVKSANGVIVDIKGSETIVQTSLRVDTLASMGYDVVNKSLLDTKTSAISEDLTEHASAQNSVMLMYRGTYKSFYYGPHVKSPTEWTNNDPLYLCLDEDGTDITQVWKALTHEHTLTTTTATEYTITHADCGIDSQYPDVQVVKVSDGTIADVTVSYLTSNNKYATKITFPSAPVSGTEYKVMFRR